MARSHRFHLDRNGHSVTVQTGAPSGTVELLVDGKVVASQRGHKDVTVLAAELPGDPPQPFTVHVDRSAGADNVPVCVWEADGSRDPLPYAPLAPRQAPLQAARTPVHPLRWLRRAMRRRLRHSRVRHR
ncbi:hypothetical protein [Streptomyces sp. TRM70350]|uniref:hypothetical protein n=1 Tax=Streptomyces sp. TRM70350 TaxID=2856165 RepID=UPI001C492F73|nr:hypothetical protein [Streptomyces sp. TRM70350]MBV7697805.1 hypothetical protein [Streptomyces sp. TRM70350]